MNDGYQMQQETTKYKNKFSYFFAKLLQGIFYIRKLLAEIAKEVVKGVLKTFGLFSGSAGGYRY